MLYQLYWVAEGGRKFPPFPKGGISVHSSGLGGFNSRMKLALQPSLGTRIDPTPITSTVCGSKKQAHKTPKMTGASFYLTLPSQAQHTCDHDHSILRHDESLLACIAATGSCCVSLSRQKSCVHATSVDARRPRQETPCLETRPPTISKTQTPRIQRGRGSRKLESRKRN